MATTNGSGGGADTWPAFLSELTKSFLILRDIFGYALPGAVFLSIGVLCRRFSLGDVQRVLLPHDPPPWLAVVFGLGACYTVGHLMSQIAYFFCNIWKFPWSPKKPEEGASGAQETTGHTQSVSALINLRESHPALLTEYERVLIMTQLRGATGAAMVAGCLLFYLFPTPPIGILAGIAGAFLLVVFWWSGIPNVDDLKRRTIQAGAVAEAAEKDKPAKGQAPLKQALERLLTAAQEVVKKL